MGHIRMNMARSSVCDVTGTPCASSCSLTQPQVAAAQGRGDALVLLTSV